MWLCVGACVCMCGMCGEDSAIVAAMYNAIMIIIPGVRRKRAHKVNEDMHKHTNTSRTYFCLLR